MESINDKINDFHNYINNLSKNKSKFIDITSNNQDNESNDDSVYEQSSKVKEYINLLKKIILKYLSDLPKKISKFNKNDFPESCNSCKGLFSNINSIDFINEICSFHNMDYDSETGEIHYDDYMTIQSYISYCFSTCICENDKLIEFVNSNEIKEEYYSYLNLVKIRKNLFSFMHLLFLKDIIEEKIKKNFIDYETEILKHTLKFPPCKSKKDIIIDDILNILITLRDKNEEDKNKDIDMLIHSLSSSDNINDVIKNLECYPCNKLYKIAEDSFYSGK
jgi:hypothetical protein